MSRLLIGLIVVAIVIILLSYNQDIVIDASKLNAR